MHSNNKETITCFANTCYTELPIILLILCRNEYNTEEELFCTDKYSIIINREYPLSNVNSV